MKWNTQTGFKVLYSVTLLTCFANISCSDSNEFVSQYSLASQPYSIGDTLIYVEANSLDTQRIVVSQAYHYFEEEEKYQSDAVIRTQNMSLFLSNIDKGNGGFIVFRASDNYNDYISYVSLYIPLDSTYYSVSASRRLNDYPDTATVNGKFYRKVLRDTVVERGSFLNYKADKYYETLYSPVHGCLQIKDRERQRHYVLLNP